MLRFGKTDDKKKGETSERIIIFKFNDGTWKVPYFLEGVSKIKTDRNLIENTRKMYQGKYAGAYDFYRFRLGDEEVVEIISKFSYEEIWKMWMDRGGKIGKDGYVACGYKFEKDDEEWNKQVMIMSMLLAFRPNKTLGTGDSELDKNLAHDFILTSLARLYAVTQKKVQRKNLKPYQLSKIKLSDMLYQKWKWINLRKLSTQLTSNKKESRWCIEEEEQLLLILPTGF